MKDMNDMSLFAKLYDRVMAPFEKRYIKVIRHKILKDSHGLVLEVGFGTGANFSLYPKDVKITGIEPNNQMIEIAKKKIGNYNNKITLLNGNAEKLPFEDNSFDTVVATLVLCSVNDLEKSIMEMYRVLKPNGTIILFEHVRLDEPEWLGIVQDKLTPPWAYICDGCQLNRNSIEVAKKYFQFDYTKKYFKNIFVTAIGRKI